MLSPFVVQEKETMSQLKSERLLSEEETILKKLEDLKCQLNHPHEDLPCLKKCSRLSNLLQKLYEIREGLKQLEQGVLQSHLKCCISPNIKVPGQVVLAVSNLSSKRHGAIIVIERENDLDEYIRD